MLLVVANVGFLKHTKWTYACKQVGKKKKKVFIYQSYNPELDCESNC